MSTEHHEPPTDEQLFEKFSRENHCAQVSYEQLERELYDCRQQVGGAFMVLKDYQKSCSPDLPTAVRNALELCNKNLRTENAGLRDQLSDLRAQLATALRKSDSWVTTEIPASKLTALGPQWIDPQPDAQSVVSPPDDLTSQAETAYGEKMARLTKAMTDFSVHIKAIGFGQYSLAASLVPAIEEVFSALRNENAALKARLAKAEEGLESLRHDCGPGGRGMVYKRAKLALGEEAKP